MSTVEERRNAPLVMVRWLDSMAYDRWENGADLLRILTEKDGGLEHLTVGWQIDENDTAIVICGSRHTVADVWNDSMAIPKVAILEKSLLVMRDGSSSEPDSASAPFGLADGGAGATGEEQSSPSATSPAAPIEQAVPDGSPGRASAAASPQPTISPAPPGKRAGAVRVERTPADQAGERGIDTRPPLQTPATSVACPDCGKVVDPRGLGTHRRHMHGHKAAPAKASVACPECGEAIAQRKNLSRHRQTHRASDPVAVPVAPIGLVLRQGASDLLTCPECGKQLKQQGYAPHMLRMHGSRLAAAPRATPGQRLAARDKSRGNGAPARYAAHEWLCDRCDAKFSSREALAVHRTSHAERPRGQPVGPGMRASYSTGGGE